ncbi:hypothetical protein FQA39_LY17519 [Lamprigera yunnana]|nr:hypothetical protein FQA39_LY17519 [Lamprigera yunnana]
MTAQVSNTIDIGHQVWLNSQFSIPSSYTLTIIMRPQIIINEVELRADIIVSVEAKMYKIRDAKNLNEADMLWLLEHDDSDVDNVETNLADSDDNEDYLSEQDEIPDEIFQQENDTISQNSN